MKIEGMGCGGLFTCAPVFVLCVHEHSCWLVCRSTQTTVHLWKLPFIDQATMKRECLNSVSDRLSQSCKLGAFSHV